LEDTLSHVKQFLIVIAVVVIGTLGSIIIFEQLVTVPILIISQSVRAAIIVASGTIVVVLIRRFRIAIGEHIGPHAASVFSFFLMLVTVLVVTLAVLHSFGASADALLLGGGAVTIILGLTASTFLGNILSGAVMFMTNPFKAGDNVLVDSIPGRIEEITTTFVRIRNDTGSETIIPNSAMLQGIVKLTKLPSHVTKSHNLPYSLGDRIYTTYIEGEGVVTEITPYHMKIHLDSEKEVTIPNNSILTGAAHIAQIRGVKDDPRLTFSFKLSWDAEETIGALKTAAEKDPNLFKSMPMILYTSLDGELAELEVTCSVDPARKEEARSILLKAAYLVGNRSSSS